MKNASFLAYNYINDYFCISLFNTIQKDNSSIYLLIYISKK